MKTLCNRANGVFMSIYKETHKSNSANGRDFTRADLFILYFQVSLFISTYFSSCADVTPKLALWDE